MKGNTKDNNVVQFPNGASASENGEPLPQEDVTAAVVARLNKEHALVTMGGRATVLTERPSKTYPGRLDRTFLGKRDMEYLYSNDLHIVGTNAKTGKQTVQTADALWNRSPDRRQYKQIIFDPTKPPGGDDEGSTFNLWRGWPIERTPDSLKPASLKKWKKTHDFLRDVIANGDKKILRWLLAWFAARLKHPERTAGVAIVLMGDEGIGKSFFAKTVVGGCYDRQHFLHVASPDAIFGRFNAALTDALVVFADEAFFAGDPTVRGRLNALVTEDSIMLEPKFLDAVQLPNMRAFIFASNSDRVVPAGPGARRFAVLKVNESKRNDRKYFADLQAELDDGGREAMIDFLLQEDFSDADPYLAPMTDALMEQKELNFSSPERFWFDLLLNAQLPVLSMGGAPFMVWSDADDAENAVPLPDIVRTYMDLPHIKKAHANDIRAVETQLGITLKKFIPSGKKRRVRLKDGNRVATWVLPSLRVARAEFEKRLGATYQWEDPADKGGE